MAQHPLTPDRILKCIADALPTHTANDTTSDLSSSYEAIALFVHACMIAVDFRLIGFQQDKSREKEFADLRPRLHSSWNATFNTHSFLYAHPQSSMQYLVKVDRLGGKAEIRGIGIADGAEKITRLEVTAKDYVSSSALPLRIPMREGGQNAGDSSTSGEKREDRTELPSKLKDVFISESRIKDLAGEIKLNILQKLIPGMHKEGYEEANEARPQSNNTLREAENQPQAPRSQFDPPHPFDPFAAPPARNPQAGISPPPTGDLVPPGFEDEHRLLPTPRGPAPMPGMRSPFNIGHDDLHPPGLGGGVFDPLRIGGVGGGSGGGMHPTFDDPLFDVRRDGRGGGIGGGGGFGGAPGQMSYDPQAPPGARWDDPGPGFGPPGSGGGGGAMGRRGNDNPFRDFW